MKPSITFTIVNKDCTPSGNWNTAKDWFPAIEVNQETRQVTVTTYDTSGFQDRASVDTEECTVTVAEDGNSCIIKGSVYVKNWRHGKCSGAQNFCFVIFEGDSGHLYTHRAPATKGWMNLVPDTRQIQKRLRKLGIGADNVIQQGDFLLKPANGSSYDDSAFKHETMGSGHHKFVAPVLYADGRDGRQYLIKEKILLIHEAVDGIQHPDIIVPPGKYIVGTTTTSLRF